ncbi:hypothetical protein TNCV_2850671 [Trichonephila clavipes]|nr:hypothetical protein TNCV_2850671 [Trichonephila clavipes]
MTAYKSIGIESKLLLPRYELCAALERSWTPHIFCTREGEPMAHDTITWKKWRVHPKRFAIPVLHGSALQKTFLSDHYWKAGDV